EVLLNYSRTECDSTQSRAVTWGVIRQPKSHVREQLRVCLEDVEVQMVEVVEGSRVVRVALHEIEIAGVFVYCLHHVNDLSQSCSPRGDQHWLTFYRGVLDRFQPIDIPAVNLVGG